MSTDELAASYGVHRAPVEVAPAIRMAAEIIGTFVKFLAESGCPLTVEQQSVVDEALMVMAENGRVAA